MEPGLRNGDIWLIRRGSRRVKSGSVIAFSLPQRPHLVQVKRVVRGEGGGWWVEGDNPHQSTDSRDFGVVPQGCVKGVLIRKISAT
jgi:phage repressor protein C with HTH and peptisase S24 domain